MKTSMFQKLLNYLQQVFQTGTNTTKHIPSAAGLKKTPESAAHNADAGREARPKSKDDAKTEADHHRRPSDSFSSESQVYKNFR